MVFDRSLTPGAVGWWGRKSIFFYLRLKTEAVDLTELMNYTLDRFEPSISLKGKSLTRRIPKGSIVTVTDREALDILASKTVDVIVTDIMMPEMDGFELCRRIKADPDLSHIPVVFITAKNDLDSKVKGLQYGAEAYIEKPFSVKYQVNSADPA